MKKRPKLNEELIARLDIVFGKTWAKLNNDVEIPRSSLYRLKDKPESIDMQQLLAIANGLKIPVSKFFYVGSIHMVEKREDYVTEPYLPCRYEYETLRNIVENRRDITWVKGYNVIGITTDNLKNSLLRDEAPVNRFLDFCYAFDIDPFTILVDPNPKQKAKRSTSSPTLLAEVAAMREEMGKLSATADALSTKYQDITAKYDDLLTKYTHLLDAHQALLQHLAVQQQKDEHYFDLAAEP